MGKYRIMTFDGGGVRGALTVRLLERLEQAAPGLLESVDLFAGTSTGAFIALGLAHGMRPSELGQFYSEETTRFIFTPAHNPLLRPKYDNTHLQQVVTKVLPSQVKLGDLKRRVLVTAFRLAGEADGSWAPVFFHNWPQSPYRDVPAADAGMCSSAAPLYFPSYQGHIDGGVVAGNPCTTALAAALDAKLGGQALRDIVLLSLGTGWNRQCIHTDTTKWGAAQWGINPDPPPAFPLLSVFMDGGVETESMIATQMLGPRFYRLNPRLWKQIAMDYYAAVPYLAGLADRANLDPVLLWLRRFWF